MRVAVIGRGLAGVVAALSARDAGAEVSLISGPPAATAMWSGVGEIFGPWYDTVDFQALIDVPKLTTPGRPPIEGRKERFDRLIRRRGFHPFARLGLNVADVEVLVKHACQLAFRGVDPAPEGFFVANQFGVPRLVDLAQPSVLAGRLGRPEPLVVVGFEHFPGAPPEQVVEFLAHNGINARALWLDAEVALTQTPAVAAAALEQLDDEALDRLADRLGSDAEGAVVLAPPILGRGNVAHRRVRKLLSRNVADVAELAAVSRSLHGFRLHESLSARLSESEIEVRRGRVNGFGTEGDRITHLHVLDADPVEADQFVLATGRASGHGITLKTPLKERVFQLPLFLEGVPLESEHTFPPKLATRRLFDDHPLFRVGLGVTDGLRPMNPAAQPAFENLYAAGLLLGGMNFTRDGSSFGVGLVTGYLAGRNAARGEGRHWD